MWPVRRGWHLGLALRDSASRFPQGEGLGFGRASSLRVLSGHKARRSSLFLLPLKGRAERKTVRRIRGATCCRTQLMAPYTPKRCTAVCALTGHTIQRAEIPSGSPKTQETACVPHANGLCDLLHVPGRAAAAPLSRSCELSPGHALGPSARLPGLPLRLDSTGTGTLRPPQPAPRNDQTLATCPLPERDGDS